MRVNFKEIAVHQNARRKTKAEYKFKNMPNDSFQLSSSPIKSEAKISFTANPTTSFVETSTKTIQALVENLKKPNLKIQIECDDLYPHITVNSSGTSSIGDSLKQIYNNKLLLFANGPEVQKAKTIVIDTERLIEETENFQTKFKTQAKFHQQVLNVLENLPAVKIQDKEHKFKDYAFSVDMIEKEEIYKQYMLMLFDNVRFMKIFGRIENPQKLTLEEQFEYMQRSFYDSIKDNEIKNFTVKTNDLINENVESKSFEEAAKKTLNDKRTLEESIFRFSSYINDYTTNKIEDRFNLGQFLKNKNRKENAIIKEMIKAQEIKNTAKKELTEAREKTQKNLQKAQEEAINVTKELEKVHEKVQKAQEEATQATKELEKAQKGTKFPFLKYIKQKTKKAKLIKAQEKKQKAQKEATSAIKELTDAQGKLQKAQEEATNAIKELTDAQGKLQKSQEEQQIATKELIKVLNTYKIDVENQIDKLEKSQKAIEEMHEKTELNGMEEVKMVISKINQKSNLPESKTYKGQQELSKLKQMLQDTLSYIAKSTLYNYIENLEGILNKIDILQSDKEILEMRTNLQKKISVLKQTSVLQNSEIIKEEIILLIYKILSKTSEKLKSIINSKEVNLELTKNIPLKISDSLNYISNTKFILQNLNNATENVPSYTSFKNFNSNWAINTLEENKLKFLNLVLRAKEKIKKDQNGKIMLSNNDYLKTKIALELKLNNGISETFNTFYKSIKSNSDDLKSYPDNPDNLSFSEKIVFVAQYAKTYPQDIQQKDLDNVDELINSYLHKEQNNFIEILDRAENLIYNYIKLAFLGEEEYAKNSINTSDYNFNITSDILPISDSEKLSLLAKDSYNLSNYSGIKLQDLTFEKISDIITNRYRKSTVYNLECTLKEIPNDIAEMVPFENLKKENASINFKFDENDEISDIVYILKTNKTEYPYYIFHRKPKNNELYYLENYVYVDKNNKKFIYSNKDNKLDDVKLEKINYILKDGILFADNHKQDFIFSVDLKELPWQLSGTQLADKLSTKKVDIFCYETLNHAPVISAYEFRLKDTYKIKNEQLKEYETPRSTIKIYKYENELYLDSNHKTKLNDVQFDIIQVKKNSQTDNIPPKIPQIKDLYSINQQKIKEIKETFNDQETISYLDSLIYNNNTYHIEMENTILKLGNITFAQDRNIKISLNVDNGCHIYSVTGQASELPYDFSQILDNTTQDVTVMYDCIWNYEEKYLTHNYTFYKGIIAPEKTLHLRDLNTNEEVTANGGEEIIIARDKQNRQREILYLYNGNYHTLEGVDQNQINNLNPIDHIFIEEDPRDIRSFPDECQVNSLILSIEDIGSNLAKTSDSTISIKANNDKNITFASQKNVETEIIKNEEKIVKLFKGPISDQFGLNFKKDMVYCAVYYDRNTKQFDHVEYIGYLAENSGEFKKGDLVCYSSKTDSLSIDIDENLKVQIEQHNNGTFGDKHDKKHIDNHIDDNKNDDTSLKNENYTNVKSDHKYKNDSIKLIEPQIYKKEIAKKVSSEMPKVSATNSKSKVNTNKKYKNELYKEKNGIGYLSCELVSELSLRCRNSKNPNEDLYKYIYKKGTNLSTEYDIEYNKYNMTMGTLAENADIFGIKFKKDTELLFNYNKDQKALIFEGTLASNQIIQGRCYDAGDIVKLKIQNNKIINVAPSSKNNLEIAKDWHQMIFNI